MHSVSLFTLVSTIIWKEPFFFTHGFLLNFFFSLYECYRNIFFPWNNLVRRTFDLLLGLAAGEQTGIRQWFGGHTLVTLIENSWHIKKKGQEGLELGDIGSVMRHGVGGSRVGTITWKQAVPLKLLKDLERIAVPNLLSCLLFMSWDQSVCIFSWGHAQFFPQPIDSSGNYTHTARLFKTLNLIYC